ncbi:S-adenosyl-L-methionine-dependent methyltransferase, partial [Desarmillaria tabescens]
RRLELQHSLLRRALCDGKSVLPPIVLRPGDKVLDSGTGTGAWVMSLAKEIPPSVSLTAIDIQSKIFPESFPRNITFSIYSVTELPGEWTDTYSLINQRVLYAALTESQWRAALSEIYRVLAPGGWVQIIEGSTISTRMGPYSEKIGNILGKLYAHKGLLIDIAKRLPDMLGREGFINVHSETRALPLGAWAGTDGLEHRDNLTSVYSAMRGPIFEADGFGLVSSEQEYDDLLGGLAKEWDNGQSISASKDWTAVYAQKVRDPNVGQRAWSSSPDVHYLLPSDAQEKQRLESQHSFLRRTLCDGKSVVAPITLGPGDKVLDSGTGSGAWILSIAKEVPSSVSLTAIDIQSKIFPKLLPPNIVFHHHSVTDLPGEWTDSYLLVNQRVLYAALTESQWNSALVETHRVLAPGGWVQFIEGSSISPHTGPYSAKIGKILAKLYTHKGLVIDVAERLPGMLAREGFVNVHSETRALPVGAWAGADRTELRDNLITVYSAMRGPIFDANGFGLVSSEREYDDLLDGLTKEWDDGPNIYEDWTVVYAQKVRNPIENHGQGRLTMWPKSAI